VGAIRLMFQSLSCCRRRSQRIHWSARGRRWRSVSPAAVTMLLIAVFYCFSFRFASLYSVV